MLPRTARNAFKKQQQQAALRLGSARLGRSVLYFGSARLGLVAGCGTLRCGPLRCGTLRCGTLRCGTLRCGTLRCGTLKHGFSMFYSGLLSKTWNFHVFRFCFRSMFFACAVTVFSVCSKTLFTLCYSVVPSAAPFWQTRCGGH